MPALALAANVGRIALLPMNGLSISVHIMDGKVSYGTTRYLITPVSGNGQIWVNADRVQFVNEKENES